jgi:PKD repeat protein
MTTPFPSVESTSSQIGRLSWIYGRGLFEIQAGTQPAAKIYCTKQLVEPEFYSGAPFNDQIRPEIYDSYGYYNTGADRLYGVFNWEDADFRRGYKVQVVSVNPRTKAIDVTLDLTSFFGISNATDPFFYLNMVSSTETRIWVTNGGGTTFTDSILLGLNAVTLAIEVNINLTIAGISAFPLNDTYLVSSNDVLELTGINTYNTYAGSATTFNTYTRIGYLPSIDEYWCTFSGNAFPPFPNAASIGNNLIVRFTMTTPGVFSAPVYDVPVNPADTWIRASGGLANIIHPSENRVLMGFIKNNYAGAVEIEVSASPTLIASYGFPQNVAPGFNYLVSGFNYLSATQVICQYRGRVNEYYQQNGGDGYYQCAVFTRDITSETPAKTFSCSPWGTQLATTSFIQPRDIVTMVYVPNKVTSEVPTRNTTPPIATPIALSSEMFLTNDFTIPTNDVVWFSIVLDGTFSLKITPALPVSLTPPPSLDDNYYEGLTPEYWTTIVAYNSAGQVVGFNGSYNQQPIAVAYDTGHWPLSIESTYPPGTYYIAVSGAGIYFEANNYCDQEFVYSAAGVVGRTIMRLRFMKYQPVVGSSSPAPLPVEPVANFSATPLLGDAPMSVAFTDLSTNSPTSWEWDFQNNGSVDSRLQNPTHIYPTAGTYSVKLVAANSAGLDPETKIDYIVVDAAPEATLMSFVSYDGASASKNVPGIFELYSNRLSYGSGIQYDSVTSSLVAPYTDLAVQSQAIRATQDSIDREFATIVGPLPAARMISRINLRTKEVLWQTSLATTSFTEVVGNTATRTWIAVYLGASQRLVGLNRSTGAIEIDATFLLTQDYGYGTVLISPYPLYLIGTNKIALGVDGDAGRYLHIVTLSEGGTPTFSSIGPYTTVSSSQLLWQSAALPNKVYHTTQDGSLTTGNVMLVEIDTSLNTTTPINAPGAISINAIGVQFNSTASRAYVTTEQGCYEFSLPGWTHLGTYGDPSVGNYINAGIAGTYFYWYDGSQVWGLADGTDSPVVQWEIGDYGAEPTRYVTYGDTYIKTYITNYYHRSQSQDLVLDVEAVYDMWYNSGNGNTAVVIVPADVATPAITYSTTPPVVAGTFNALNVPTPITLTDRVTWYQINYTERLPWFVYMSGQTTTMHAYIFDAAGVLLMTYHPSSNVTGFSPHSAEPGTYYIAFVVTNDSTADSRVTFASRGFKVSAEQFPVTVGTPINFSPYTSYGTLP